MIDKFSLEKLEKKATILPEFMKKIGNRPMILFGSGGWGLYYYKFLRSSLQIKVLFCDNDSRKWGTLVEGIPVISFDELKNKYSDCYITITTLNYYDEIYEQLKAANLHGNIVTSLQGLTDDCYKDYYTSILNNFNSFAEAYSLLSDERSRQIFYARLNSCISTDIKHLLALRSKSPQYFEPGIINLSDSEIFVDGGAYTGDTIDELLKQTSGKYGKVYSFEPEKTKHKEFLDKYSGFENIELLPYGLWSRKEILHFSAQNSGGSRVSDNGNIEIPVISIDEVLQGDPATFIKMDIEGAELEALKGAENTIRQHKPKLAICVYHKPFDIVEIPLYLNKIVPEYKLYLRHYNINIYETVCYAIAD